MNFEKNELRLYNIGFDILGGGLIGLFIAFIFLLLLRPAIALLLISVSGLACMSGIILIIRYEHIEKSEYIKYQNLFQKEYDEYVDKAKIVRSTTKVTLFDTDRFDSEISQYIWIANDCINIYPRSEYYRKNAISSVHRPNMSELKLRTIPIRSILYFEEIGELRQYAMVSGGGTSLKGALLGYALAEDLGAIICSREPVTTEIVSNDDRRVELIYKNQNNDIENLEFTHDAYSVFKQLIPSKELRRICALNSIKEKRDAPNKSASKNQTVKKKLKQLQGLKEEGLITEEEFMQQKQKILDSI